MDIRKAVTFRASSIGDALNAKYVFENLHATFPDARYALVVAGRGAMIRDLLAAYPWIEVREANRRDLPAVFRLWKEFRGSDLFIAPLVKPGGTFSFFSKIMARLLASRGGLIGYRDASRLTPFLYDRIYEYDPSRAPRHYDRMLLVDLQIPVTIPQTRLARIPQPGLLPKFGLTPKSYLVLHLFAGSENRAMSQRKRQELIDALADALPHTMLVLTGTKADKSYIDKLSLPPRSMTLAGELSVQDLMELISESGCMVSIGTGPSHIASNLGKKPIVLVICSGMPWCGPDQFDEEAGMIFSDTAACPVGHDTSQTYPPCIEGIDVTAVARAAAERFG